jgi:hypothetical protein
MWKKCILVLSISMTIISMITTSGFSGSKFAENYIVSIFADEIDMGVADYPGAILTEMTLNANGMVFYQDLHVTSGSPENGSFTYASKPDGKFQFEPMLGILWGILSPSGEVFTVASSQTSEPNIIFGIQKPSGITQEGIAGQYYMVWFADEVVNPGPSQSTNSPYACLSSLVLLSDGSGTLQDLACSDGEQDSYIFSWSVDATGNLTVTVTDEDTVNFYGVTNQDGSIFTLVDTRPVEPSIMVGIKKSAGMSVQNLKGKYAMAEFHDNITSLNPPTANSPWSGFIELNMDGQGNGTFKMLKSSDPGDESESGSFTYTVAADGKLVVTSPDDTLQGVVHSNGDVFVIAHTDNPVQPGILIGIKQSPTASPATPLLLLSE